MTLRQPTLEELHELGIVAAQAGVFDSVDDLVAFWRGGPWRVVATPQGDAAVLERWREHLDWLAMRAAWVAPRRLSGVVDDVRELARERGFRTVLSPFVGEDRVAPWVRAGMRPLLRVAMLRRELGTADLTAPFDVPPGFTLAEGGPEDVDRLLALDARCFEPEWAYDRELVERYVARDRVVLALDEAGELAGYAMAGRAGGEALVGRLAVGEPWRRRGLALALLAQMHRGLAAAGAPYVTLTTQAENVGAQRLYDRAGYHRLRGQLVGLTVPV